MQQNTPMRHISINLNLDKELKNIANKLGE